METAPGNRPPTPDEIDPAIQQQVDDKVREQHISNLAFLEITSDPEMAEAAAERLAREDALRNETRMRTTRIIRSHEREAEARSHEYPYGIRQLERPLTIEAVYEEVGRAALADVELKGKAADETERTQEDMEKWRKFTIETAQKTAEKLKEAGRAPEIEVFTVHTEYRRKWRAWGTYEGRSKLRKDMPVKRFEQETRGWVLPLKGQIDPNATAILCENGQILIAYGDIRKKPEYDKEDQLKEVGRFEVQANYYGEKKPKQIEEYEEKFKNKKLGKAEEKSYLEHMVQHGYKYRDRIHYSYLTEDPESDIAAASRPVRKDNPLGYAFRFFAREDALQKAVVSLWPKFDLAPGEAEDGDDETQEQAPTAQQLSSRQARRQRRNDSPDAS